MINITVSNDDTVDLFVTLTDNNTMPPSTPLTNERINAGNSKNTSVQEDGNLQGNVVWTAVRTDDATIRKSQNATPSAGDIIGVNVFGV